MGACWFGLAHRSRQTEGEMICGRLPGAALALAPGWYNVAPIALSSLLAAREIFASHLAEDI